MQPFAWVCRWRCVGVSGLSSGGRAEQDAAWQQLWAADELMAQSEGLTDPDTAHVTLRGEVLYGWRTTKPRFAPTFKVTRHTPEHVYERKRIPSYCDRVLWTALSGFLPRVTVREYTSDPSFDTSDHKPVKCLFDVSPVIDFSGSDGATEMRSRAGSLPDSDCIRIAFSHLSCDSIERDKPVTDAINPYIKIYSYPPNLLSNTRYWHRDERCMFEAYIHAVDMHHACVIPCLHSKAFVCTVPCTMCVLISVVPWTRSAVAQHACTSSPAFRLQLHHYKLACSAVVLAVCDVLRTHTHTHLHTSTCTHTVHPPSVCAGYTTVHRDIRSFVIAGACVSSCSVCRADFGFGLC
eukprot:m.15851 g.15851  ORF g.15851 m.15851 type:complete len:350 (-) comp10818_c0_seq2:647-1696(-)